MKIYDISCWNINNHVSFNVIDFIIIYIDKKETLPIFAVKFSK